MSAPALVRTLTLAAVSVALTIVCQAAPPSSPSDHSARTYDGLYPIDNVNIDGAWARPDFDLNGYDKVMLQDAGIQYRPIEHNGSESSDHVAKEFPLTHAQKARLDDEMRRTFKTELGRSERFALTDTPGPDVLIIRGGLLDVVSRVPPESLKDPEIFLDSIGEATLVIELLDSESGAVLVRAVDRRAAQQAGRPVRSNSVSNWQEVQRMFQHWAYLLRTGLDELDVRLTLE